MEISFSDILRGDLKAKAREALRGKGSLEAFAPSPMGDRLIFEGAVLESIRRFAESQGIPFGHDTRGVLQTYTGQLMPQRGVDDVWVQIRNLADIQAIEAGHDANELCGETAWEEKLRQASNALGVEQSDRPVGPPITRRNWGILEGFDESAVLREMDRGEGGRDTIIIQAGSLPEKRFSRDQVEVLIAKAREIWGRGDHRVRVVTDNGWLAGMSVGGRGDGRLRFPWEDSRFLDSLKGNYPQADETFDLGDRLSHGAILAGMALADKIITTDTGPAWLASGMQGRYGRRGVGKGQIAPGVFAVLYTTAKPERWGLPIPDREGLVASYALLNAPDTVVNSQGMVIPVFHNGLFNAMSHYRQYSQEGSGVTSVEAVNHGRGIRESDFEKLIGYISGPSFR